MTRQSNLAACVMCFVTMAMAGVSESVELQITDQSSERSPAAATDDDSVRDAFAKSCQYESAGKYQQAIDALRPASGLAEQQYLLSLRLGWLHYLNGDFEDSGENYRSAIEAAPETTEPRVGYLLPLLAQFRYREAETVARGVLEIDPRNYYANLRLANALRNQRKLDEAQQTIASLLDLQPTDVGLLGELALVYDAGGRREEAREVYAKMLLLAPDNALAREQLGLPESSLADDLDDLAGTEAAWADDLCRCYPLTTSVSPYYGYLDYGSQSIKSHGNTWGVYGVVSVLNSLEANYGYTELGYRNGAVLEQHDITAVYSYLGRPGLRIRFGGHLIENNDPFTDGAWTMLAGAHYYQTNVWDAGVDAYFTRYDNYPMNQSITQITPHVGIQQFTNGQATVRLDLRGYYINTDEAVYNVGKEDFYSLEARWGLNRGRFGLALSAWTGEQVFAVRQDGFVIFNLAEKHLGGYGGEFTFRLHENSILTARISDEQFADIVSGAGTHQLVSTFLWTRTF